jgi:Skp family chaperone for outer membrane proteins
VEALDKKMQQLENELAHTQTNLETASHNLEEKEKALQNVCHEELLRDEGSRVSYLVARETHFEW